MSKEKKKKKQNHISKFENICFFLLLLEIRSKIMMKNFDMLYEIEI